MTHNLATFAANTRHARQDVLICRPLQPVTLYLYRAGITKCHIAGNASSTYAEFKWNHPPLLILEGI